MQIYFPFFRTYLEEVFARWTSAAPDHSIWFQQSFEVCCLQTGCALGGLLIGQGRSRAWNTFAVTPCVITGHHWEREVTISGVTSSDFILIVGAALRDAPLTQESSLGIKKCWLPFFLLLYFHLNIWKQQGKLTLHKQPTAYGLHFGEPPGVLYLWCF